MDYLQNRMRRSVTVTIPVEPPVTLSLAALGTPGEDQASITPAEALAAQALPEVLRGEISIGANPARPAFVRGGAAAPANEPSGDASGDSSANKSDKKKE